MPLLFQRNLHKSLTRFVYGLKVLQKMQWTPTKDTKLQYSIILKKNYAVTCKDAKSKKWGNYNKEKQEGVTGPICLVVLESFF